MIQEYFSQSLDISGNQRGGDKFLGKPILQNVWIILFNLLYYNLKKSIDPNSSSFMTIQCILHDSGVLFSEPWCFYKLQTGYLISGRNWLWRMSELFSPPLLYFSLKSSMEPNSSSFIRCQYILDDPGVLFWEPWYFFKLKTGYLISGVNQFWRVSELFDPPFCISISKVF